MGGGSTTPYSARPRALPTPPIEPRCYLVEKGGRGLEGVIFIGEEMKLALGFADPFEETVAAFPHGG